MTGLPALIEPLRSVVAIMTVFNCGVTCSNGRSAELEGSPILNQLVLPQHISSIIQATCKVIMLLLQSCLVWSLSDDHHTRIALILDALSIRDGESQVHIGGGMHIILT